MENTNIYDVAIIGGGVSGCACAWGCAKSGLKTVLIEKRSFLGGAISGGIVLPMMKTDDKKINTEFYNELLRYSDKYTARITYSDGNDGWFNPELMKIVLDEMLTDAGVQIYFNSDINNIKVTDYNNCVDKIHNDKILSFVEIKRNILSYYVDKIYNDKIIKQKNKKNEKFLKNNFKNLFKEIYAKYFVDASGDAIISEMLNARMQPDNDLKQAETLRFIMANVNNKEFCRWLEDKDPDRNTTNVTRLSDNEYYMTTAYTWDSDKKWALSDIFHAAVENGDLEEEDTAYFQIFGIAKMPDAVSFNCPRIDQTLPYEQKLLKGRKAIFRLANFCIKYFPGFENAYISHIADELGVRVSNRPLAVYNYTVDDIINGKEFKNTALHSNYPIDIHSNKKDGYVLDKTKGYDFPIESMMSAEYGNLFTIGKAVGADFKSQAALRVQKSCFSMGEAVSKHIKSLIK